jgi:hypothetical protein
MMLPYDPKTPFCIAQKIGRRKRMRGFVSPAGEESLVLEDGGCTLLLEQFFAILKSYKGKHNVTVRAGEKSLRLFTTTLSVTGYTKTVQPPAYFFVGSVTDTWVTGGAQ